MRVAAPSAALSVFVLTILVVLSGRTASAQEINSCGTAAAQKERSMLLILLYPVEPRSSARGHLRFEVVGSTLRGVDGALNVTDGTSNTIAFVESSSATMTCADIDGNGITGIALLAFNLIDLETGKILPVRVVPDAGELEPGEVEDVTLYIGEGQQTNPFRVRWVDIPEQ